MTDAEFAALAAKIGNRAAKAERQARAAAADAANPSRVWHRAAKSWIVGMGMSRAAVVRQLQCGITGFGISAAEASSTASAVGKEIEAEAAVSAARRNAEAPHEAEFNAAWKAAARMVTVYDEDGGTSQDLRVPPDWAYEGCRTVGAFLKKRGF